jgi:hypothetical protein
MKFSGWILRSAQAVLILLACILATACPFNLKEMAEDGGEVKARRILRRLN